MFILYTHSNKADNNNRQLVTHFPALILHAMTIRADDKRYRALFAPIYYFSYSGIYSDGPV